MLIEAARGLLSGTTNVLITFDAFEIRKIVTLGSVSTNAPDHFFRLCNTQTDGRLREWI